MEHLEGITILNEYMTYETPWFATLLFILAAISAVVAIVGAANGQISICSIGFICFGIFFILAMISTSGLWDIETGIIYECTIADDVTYKKLTDVYEIVGQRGNIYKLKFQNN